MAAGLAAYREIHQFGGWNNIQVDHVVLVGPQIYPAQPFRLFLVLQVNRTLFNALRTWMRAPDRRITRNGGSPTKYVSLSRTLQRTRGHE